MEKCLERDIKGFTALSEEEMQQINGGSVSVGAIAATIAALGLARQNIMDFGVFVKQEWGVKKLEWYHHLALATCLTPLSYVWFINGFNSVN